MSAVGGVTDVTDAAPEGSGRGARATDAVGVDAAAEHRQVPEVSRRRSRQSGEPGGTAGGCQKGAVAKQIHAFVNCICIALST